MKVVAAGYTPVQVDMMTAALVRSAYADDIINCADGDKFLSQITQLIRTKNPPRLTIIEVAMPIMNGINAALCMRSIEKAVSREKIPILYFTQRKLDDPFVRAIKFLSPAKYVPLPPKPDTETFRQRVDQMVELLKKENW